MRAGSTDKAIASIRPSRLCSALRLCAIPSGRAAVWRIPVLLAALILFIGETAAQPLAPDVVPFIVRDVAGEPLRNPFTGGLDLTRIGLLDIDGNGRPDLFTLNLGETLRLYRNDGALPLRLDTSSFWKDVPVRSWFRFADIDADADLDLFTSGERSELMILRNDGANLSPSFAPPDTLRQGGGEVVYTEQQTVPTFVDIDADGDLDLFSGNIDGSITWYENTGTPQTPVFTFRTSKFEGIIVISPARAKEKSAAVQGAAHGASVLDFVDMDGDDDLDMLFGDFFTRRLLHFENRGTRFRPDFDTLWVDTAFAPNGDVVDSRGFNQAVSGDMDGDRDTDVIVSSLLASSAERPLELFLNEGSSDVPVMRRSAVNLTSEIDVGRHASPALLRDDERQGVLIGSEDGSITWYELTEEGGKTVWRLSRRYVLDGVTLSSPAAADLDGDGRAEIVVGKADASDGSILRLYRFQGSELVRVPWQLDTSSNVVRRNASPALVDIDDDGDLDLFVGAGNGRLYLFENIGTPVSPVFEARTPPAPFDAIDFDEDTAPRFGDLDGDGDPDLVVGNRGLQNSGYDTLRFWLNDGGSFRQDAAWPPMTVAFNPVPMPVAFSEGRFLLVGTKAGGLLAFHDTTSISSAPPDNRDGDTPTVEISVGRASGIGSISVRWSGMHREARTSRLVIVDLTGRERMRAELEGGEGALHLSVEELPSGLYLWRVRKAGSGTIRIVR